MKLIWYITLILLVATVPFSGYTKLSDKIDEYTVEVFANGAQIRNAIGYTINSNGRSFDE